MAPVFNPQAFYRNLGRIFRNGPSVPHQIANRTAEPGQPVGVPVGTAAAYFTNKTNSFANYGVNYSNPNRLARYADYQSMESMAEIASALDIYSHETAAKDEYGKIIRVHSDDPQKKKALEMLLTKTLNVDFNAVSWVRAMCKYGDYFLLLDHSTTHGVMNAIPLPVNELEREEGYDPKNPKAYRFRWTTNGNKIINSWEVLHFRMSGNDTFLPYGMSVLEPARRAWRQLGMLEDAVMVYRIVRSPERRVFYVDVGNIAPNDVPALMNQMRDSVRRNQIVDPNTGQVDLRYNALSTDEDFYLAVRGQDNATRIETLQGGAWNGDIDDLQYIQNKLFAALKVPKSYLGYEGDGQKANLSQQDCRFARTIQHVQDIFIAELNKVCAIHLFTMGYGEEDCFDFQLSMANPSSINEIQRLELWRTRFEVASTATAQDGILDKDFVYKHIFKLNDAEIETIEEGRRKDKLLQLEIDGMQLPVDPDAGGADTGAEGDAGAGGAGAAGGAPAPYTGEDPDAASDGSVDANVNAPLDNNAPQASQTPPTGEARDRNTQRAIPNALKGKRKPKHRKPDSDYSLVYRTKKNGLDPKHAVGQLRRVATAPFGEGDEVFARQIRTLNAQSEGLRMAIELCNSKKKLNE